MTAAGGIVGAVRAKRSAVGVAVIQPNGDVETHLDAGADEVDDRTLFDIGSVTKTLTATLLGVLVTDGRAALDKRIGDVISAGRSGRITLEQLATHTSGLPRIPQRLLTSPDFDIQDPYRFYRVPELLATLREDGPDGEVGSVQYSNLGYMVLGYVLGVIVGTSYGEALASLVLEPLGMEDTIVPERAPAEAAQGYSYDEPVPAWSSPLPGAGGVLASLTDSATWARANVFPEQTPLVDALRLVQESRVETEPGEAVCLGWHRREGVTWHNGATAGTSTFVGFDAAERRGVAIITNAGHLTGVVDGCGFEALGRSSSP